MRGSWACSAAVHAAILVAAAAVGVGSLIRPKDKVPVVISSDVRPEPRVRFAASRVVFSEEVVSEPRRRSPEPERREPQPVEEVEHPPEPVRPQPRRLSVSCCATPPRLLKSAPRKEPEREVPSPAPRPVATRSEPAPPVPVAGNPPPRYPDAARRDGVEGTVLVRLKVDRRGRVLDAEVSRSSGSKLLDQAAVSALRRWRFKATDGGRLTAGFTVVVPVKFSLRGSS